MQYDSEMVPNGPQDDECPSPPDDKGGVGKLRCIQTSLLRDYADDKRKYDAENQPTDGESNHIREKNQRPDETRDGNSEVKEHEEKELPSDRRIFFLKLQGNNTLDLRLFFRDYAVAPISVSLS